MNSPQRKEADQRSYVIKGQFFAASPLESGLYVVATPIGHLGDVTIRALETLAAADIVACEDTRVTHKLLSRYGIQSKVISYHEHSAPAAHRRVLAALAAGLSVALVADAGTPLISDPGARLVEDAVTAGHRAVPIPGPSAVVAALAAAGLVTDAFLFLGFLPAKSAARRKRLTEFAALDATLVLFESPRRIGALLADALAVLGEREAALCRELTKLHETIDRGSLGELARRYAEAEVRGEIVLLIAPAPLAPRPADFDVETELRAALRTMSVKEAAGAVARSTGLSRRELYQKALALKDGA